MKFKKIKQLIQEDNLDVALAELQKVLTEGVLADELLIIISNYNSVKSDIRKNLLAFEEATIKENRIRNAVLELIDAAESGRPLRSTQIKAAESGKRKSYLGLKIMVGITLVFVSILFIAILIPSIVNSKEEPEPPAPTTETHNNISDNDNVMIGDNNTVIMNEAEKEVDPATAEISFQSYSEQFSEHLNNDPEKVKAEVSLSFEDPISYFDEDRLRVVKLQLYKDAFGEAAVPGNFKASAAKYSRSFFTDFQQAFGGGDIEFEPQMYYITRAAKVLYNKNQVLTVRISEDAYTGGIHGNSYDYYYTYDLKTGKALSISDLFRGKTQNAVIKLLQKELMTINGVNSLAELEDLGYWEVTIPKNFYFNKKSICFVYSPYEAAAYVDGKNVICLKYDDIVLYFHEDFPLHRLFD